jgi:hypothetical protein
MKFATIEKSTVVKQIGRLSKTDRSDLQQKWCRVAEKPRGVGISLRGVSLRSMRKLNPLISDSQSCIFVQLCWSRMPIRIFYGDLIMVLCSEKSACG